MSNSDKTAKLVVHHGVHLGREYVLKGDSVTIGSNRDCNIVLRGRYVAERHAVLEHHSNGVWIIKNQSVNGTFVNDERIVTHSLADGDLVRLGPETILAFQGEGNVKGAKKRRKRRAKGGRRSVVAQRPALLIGIGVYLLGLAGFGFFLNGLNYGKDAGQLSAHLVRRVLEDTRAFLVTTQELVVGNRIAWSGNATIDDRAEPAARYYRFLAYKSRVMHGETPRDASQESTMIDGLLADLHQQLFRAWNLESQARWKEAMDAYGKALAVIPDLRVPAARLAAYRQYQLKERITP
jgi:pSer/pThr/pTyr-binding forkhead associated (FHA) protein